MRRGNQWVRGIALMVGLVGSGHGAQAEEQAFASAPSEQISGTIAAVDAASGRLTLDEGFGPGGVPQRVELVVDDETIVSKGGIRLTPADLEAGEDTVTIQYAARDGKRLFARTITFEEPPGLREIAGAVDRIDVLNRELIVKVGGPLWSERRMTFAVDESTLVSQGGERAYLTMVMPGDQIAIQYLNQGDRSVARFVAFRSRRQGMPLGWRGAPSRGFQQAPQEVVGHPPSR